MFFSSLCRCIRCCYADLHPSLGLLHQTGEEGVHEVCPEDRGKTWSDRTHVFLTCDRLSTSHHTLLLLRPLCSSSWDSWWWSAAWHWSSRTGSTMQDLQMSTPTATSGRVLTLIDRQMGGAKLLTLQLRTRRSCSSFSAEQRQTSHSERMSWTLYSMLLGHTDGTPLVLLCFFFWSICFLLCCSSSTAEFSVVRRTGTRASFSVFRLGVSYSQPKRFHDQHWAERRLQKCVRSFCTVAKNIGVCI